MLNMVGLQGRLTRDVEIRYTQNNKAVASFTLANSRKSGDDARFFDCVAWENTAEFMSKYLVKGQMIVVDGHLQTREYTDKEGKKRKVTEIVADSVHTCGRSEQKESEPTFSEIVDTGDELPF